MKSARTWTLSALLALIALLALSYARLGYVSGRGFAFGTGGGRGWWARFPEQPWSADPTGLYRGQTLEDWGTFWSFDIGPGGKLLLDRAGRGYHQFTPWWPAAAMLLATGWVHRKSILRAVRRLKRDPMKCRKCGYDLQGLPRGMEGTRCPECGRGGERVKPWDCGERVGTVVPSAFAKRTNNVKGTLEQAMITRRRIRRWLCWAG